MATRKTVRQSVALLCEVYNRKCSELMIEAYMIGLEELTDHEVLHAVKHALKGEHQFMPSPGTLRSLVRSEADENNLARRRRNQQTRHMLSSDANQAKEYDGKSIADMFRERHELN